MGRWAWAFLGLGSAAAIGHVLLPGDVAPGAVYDGLGLAAVLAVGVGIRRNQPVVARGWWCIAGALLLLTAGDVVWDVAVHLLGHDDDFVPAADALYLSAYPLLFVGLRMLNPGRPRGVDAKLDAVIVCAAATAMLWELTVGPEIAETRTLDAGAIITVAYPILDVIVIVIVLYAVCSLPRRVPSTWLLLGGVAVTTVADVAYARLDSTGALAAADWLNPLFPLSYVIIGAAALHPSMRELGSSGVVHVTRSTRVRVALLGVALLALFFAAIMAQSEQRSTDVAVFTTALAASTGLVVWRMTHAVGEAEVAHDELLHKVGELERTDALLAGETRLLGMVARGEPLTRTLREAVTLAEAQLGGRRCEVTLADPIGAAWQTAGTGRHRLERTRWCVPLVAEERRLGALVVFDVPQTATAGPVGPPEPSEVTAVERVAALAAVAVDRARAEDLLEHQAFHDPLTGLPNRALLLDRLDLALRRLERHRRDPGRTTAVIFLDLDRFKVINDSLGHDTGDELLTALAERITPVLQAADTVARFGGDEFVIVCERVGGVSDALAIAERVSGAITAPVILSNGVTVVMTASVGIALARGANDQAQALLRDADTAMYRAKELGGARIEVFDALLRSEVVARLDTERSLRRAIEQEQLRVHYQPIVDLTTGRTVTFEALARWQHPARGLIGPDEFIEVAEETGLIFPLTMWVLEKVCDDLGSDRLHGASASVNISGRQLARPDLIPTLQRILDAHGVEPNRLGLEITERVLLTDVGASSATLQRLADLGVVVALDDFGTGYSSLAYLRQFPFDYLKVDETFVAGLGVHRSDEAIVAATVQMARGLGMRGVVAEGVEHRHQMLRAGQLGCQYAQGHYFAAPRPIEELAAQYGGRSGPVPLTQAGA